MGFTDLDIGSQTIPEMRLVTAKSFLIDRIDPQCEQVILPQRQLRPGKLRLESGEVRLRADKRRFLSAVLPNARENVPDGRWVFDMRLEDPENWAHFLNDHLPLFFCAAHETGRDPTKALLLLPSDVPTYISGVAAMFGLECWPTDATVIGDGVVFEMMPYIANRTARHEWVRLPYPQSIMEKLLADPAQAACPEKVFLIREKQRALSNHAQVQAYLEAKGFVAVLPETLTPEEQFLLFLNAREMVAVSGAALAPLLYTRAPERGPVRVIELQPCGHMSTVYREMAHLVGSHFVGVRGRIKPQYVGPAYEFNKLFRKFSHDNFHIDLDSLDLAFTL